MSPFATVERVRAALVEVFTRLGAWFDLPDQLLGRRPDYPGAWSVLEHLEHVCLADHFLLLTIARGCGKALKRAARGEIEEGESDLARLVPIAWPGAFEWVPPSHMLPTGQRRPAEIGAELERQRDKCLALLAAMPHGEGKLCRVRMSVQGLGRLDMYQWLYFLAQHGRYHLVLIERIGGGSASSSCQGGGGGGAMPHMR